MPKCSFILAMCLALALCGCGKKGDPTPQDQKNAFAWGPVSASFASNGCLLLSGVITGAAGNVDGFSVELEPLAAPIDATLPPELRVQDNTCEGCPFTPRETSEITPQEALQVQGGTRFNFTYCPKRSAPGFRWRLVARNVFMSFPFAVTPVGTIRK